MPTILPAAPLIGVAAAVVGALIAALNTRIRAFGLADIVGGLKFGFYEGSWHSGSSRGPRRVAAA